MAVHSKAIWICTQLDIEEIEVEGEVPSKKRNRKERKRGYSGFVKIKRLILESENRVGRMSWVLDIERKIGVREKWINWIRVRDLSLLRKMQKVERVTGG